MSELIRVDGSTEHVTDFSLTNLQRLVGGYIELLYGRNGKTFVVDDEGKLKNKPVNYTASMMYGSRLVGDVVVGAKMS